MTLPIHPNTIRMQGADSISGEFGGPGTDLTQYYAGGAYVPGGTIGYPYGVATPIPTSGTISLSNFHGSKREYLLTFYDDAQWTVPAGVTKCDIVVVAGGGAGGPSHTSSIEGGGGGGAGGVLYQQNVSLHPGAVVNIRVGNGGTSFGTWKAIFPYSRLRSGLSWQELTGFVGGNPTGPINPDWAEPTGAFSSYFVSRGDSENNNDWGQSMAFEMRNKSALPRRLRLMYRDIEIGRITLSPSGVSASVVLIHRLVQIDTTAGHDPYYELQRGQDSAFGAYVATGGGVGGGNVYWFGENSTSGYINTYVGFNNKTGGWGGSGGGGYGWHGWAAGGGSVYGQGTNGGEGIEESWAMSGGGGGAGSAGTGYAPGGGRSFNLAGSNIVVGGGGAGGGWGHYAGGWGGGGYGANRWAQGGAGTAYTGGGGGGGGADGGGGGSGGKGVVYVLVR